MYIAGRSALRPSSVGTGNLNSGCTTRRGFRMSGKASRRRVSPAEAGPGFNKPAYPGLRYPPQFAQRRRESGTPVCSVLGYLHLTPSGFEHSQFQSGAKRSCAAPKPQNDFLGRNTPSKAAEKSKAGPSTPPRSGLVARDDKVKGRAGSAESHMVHGTLCDVALS